jgi:hypothetical protein
MRELFNRTKPGSLHKALGVKPGVTIPMGKLRWAMKHFAGGTRRERALAMKAALTYRLALKRLAR